MGGASEQKGVAAPAGLFGDFLITELDSITLLQGPCELFFYQIKGTATVTPVGGRCEDSLFLVIALRLGC